MSLPLEEKPYLPGVIAPGDRPWKFRTWSAEEWGRIPADRRPAGVIKAGTCLTKIVLGPESNAGAGVNEEAANSDRGGSHA